MRVATFNILSGRRLADGAVDPAGLAADVAALDADVLGLQEVTQRPDCDLTAVAAAAMGASAARFLPALDGIPGAPPAAGEGYGIALCSRYPVLRWHEVRLRGLPVSAPLLLGRPRRWVVVRDEPRVALVAEMDTPHGVWSVAVTHLSFVPAWNAVQLRRVVTALAALPRPQLLLGDLNTPWPRAAGWRRLAAAPTFPVGAPTRQLDHVLARGDVGAVSSARAVAGVVSDHRALVVQLDGA